MILLLLTLNYATFFSFSEHDFSIHFIYRDKIKHTKPTKTTQRKSNSNYRYSTSSYFFHYFGATYACPTTDLAKTRVTSLPASRRRRRCVPIITVTIIASRIENEEERIIALGGDTLIEIHSVNSLDKSISVARLSRIISHANDRQLSGHASMCSPLEFEILRGEARILFRGGRGGGRSGLRRLLCILRD